MPWPKGVPRPKETREKISKNNGGPSTKLEIDVNLVEKLASIMCTMEEIASMVGCSVDTLENRFADVIKKNREKGKASLRRQQYLSANSGSVPMQIFLGKVYLKQRENDDELTHEQKNLMKEFCAGMFQMRKNHSTSTSPTAVSPAELPLELGQVK